MLRGVRPPGLRVRAAATLLPAAFVALAAHAALWGAWAPADGTHAYFGWYEPLLAGVGTACLVAMVALVAAAALSTRFRAAGTLVRRLNEELGHGTVTRVVVRGPAGPRRMGPLRVRGTPNHNDDYG